MAKRLMFRGLTALVMLIVLEAGARAGLALTRDRGGLIVEPAFSGRLTEAQRNIIRTRIVGGAMEYTDYSSLLGWTIKPQGRSNLYHSNSQGMRGVREYAIDPSPAVTRFAVFGDSYTHGDDVSDDQTWAAQVERLNPAIEVLNFGVGGFGPDQALLRFENEGLRFRPAVAILGFRPENIYRLVSVFRPFYTPATGVPMSKPRFTEGPNGLAVLANPISSRAGYQRLLDDDRTELARLGEHDYFYQRSYRKKRGDAMAGLLMVRLLAHEALLGFRRAERIEAGGTFNEDSEAFRVLTRVFQRFRDGARAAGARPLILILPDDDDIRQFQAGKGRRYAPLLKVLESQGLDVLDLMETFDAHTGTIELSALFSGHYNAAGNHVVATALDSYIRAHGFARQ